MTINISIPTHWNQLSFRQLKGVSRILEHYHSQKEEVQTSIIYFTRVYFKLIKQLLQGNNFIKTWIAISQIPPNNYRDHLEFIFKGVSRTTFEPRLKVDGRWKYPPRNRMSNITIKEFSFLDAMFYNWKNSKDHRYLDLLCASLYRDTGGTPIDCRVPFDKILIEDTVSQWNDVDNDIKLAIGYTYEGCRNYITSLYPNVFPKGLENQVDVDGNKINRKPQKYVPFGKLIQHKVGYDPSKMEATWNLLATDFLSNWENELIEIKKIKK